MKYSQIRSMDISNGEGVGVALFVQGCHFHCNNCFNSETWDFNGGKEWTDETEEEFLELVNFFINFCPFCGEKIEVSVVEEKDISDTYKKLEEKKNFFEEEIWNIDRQIAELYKVSEYPEVDSLCISKKNFCI